MSVRRQTRREETTGKDREFWIVDVEFTHPDGTTERIRRVPPVQTKRGAEQFEHELRELLLDGEVGVKKKEVPTFEDWFNGRFWREWVIGRKNKPSEVEAKRSIFAVHLKDAFGAAPLDTITDESIAKFRFALLGKSLGEKRINNILAVLSKSLRYAADVALIDRAPRVGLFKVERPEFECWSFEEYAQLLETAKQISLHLHLAVCLAGEAGLRIGEIKALEWRRDVDMIAKTLTVNKQTRHGETGTPKGRTRRTIPMTETLFEALRAMNHIRTGFVLRNEDGTQKTDNQMKNVSYRLCRKAGLEERGWHVLRHTYGTHAAHLGVNPWTLMMWLGHKRIDETMLYVNLAHQHARPIHEKVLAAGAAEVDPNRRIVKMLGARGHLTATDFIESAKVLNL